MLDELIKVSLDSNLFAKSVSVNEKSVNNGSEFNSTLCSEMAVKLESGALVVKNKNPGKHHIAIYLECKSCRRKFNFNINWEAFSYQVMEFIVYGDKNKSCLHPHVQSSRPITGNLRKEVGKDLQTQSIANYRDKQVLTSNQEIALKTGNLQTIVSPAVYAKIRQENIAQYDLDKNDLIDVHKMALSDLNKNEKLIQRVSTFPFTVLVSFNLIV